MKNIILVPKIMLGGLKPGSSKAHKALECRMTHEERRMKSFCLFESCQIFIIMYLCFWNLIATQPPSLTASQPSRLLLRHQGQIPHRQKNRRGKKAYHGRQANGQNRSNGLG